MSNCLKMNQVNNDKKANRYIDKMDVVERIEQEESENRRKNESESKVTDIEEDNESIKGKELYNECKGLLIEIEFDIKMEQQKCELVIIQHTIELVKNWKEKQVIGGVQGIKEVKITDFNNFDKWLHVPRVIEKKTKSVKAVEVMIRVYTNQSIYKLYNEQKEVCHKYRIRISTKRMNIEYTKRIGFLTGPYVRIASSVYYFFDIKKKLKIGTGIIEVKKEYTYERGERSKVLMVYAIESLAQQIDKMFSNLELERYKYVSYRMSNSKV